MAKRRLRMLGMAGLLCCLPLGLSAQADRPSAAVYESFFQQVVRVAIASDTTPVLINGEPSTVQRPSPREAIGLTENEARVLNELATDYAAESQLLDDAVRRLTFERRMRVISSQEIPERLTQAQRDLDETRARIVKDHVERLEAAFGAQRFQALNGYIRSREKDGEFFPVVPDPNRPVPKKATALKK